MLKEKKEPKDQENGYAEDPFWPRELEDRLNRLHKTTMEVKVVLGRAQLTLDQISQLKAGTIVETSTLSGQPMEVLVNGTLFGKGEIIVIGDRLAVRITWLLKPEEMVND